MIGRHDVGGLSRVPRSMNSRPGSRNTHHWYAYICRAHLLVIFNPRLFFHIVSYLISAAWFASFSFLFLSFLFFARLRFLPCLFTILIFTFFFWTCTYLHVGFSSPSSPYHLGGHAHFSHQLLWTYIPTYRRSYPFPSFLQLFSFASPTSLSDFTVDNSNMTPCFTRVFFSCPIHALTSLRLWPYLGTLSYVMLRLARSRNFWRPKLKDGSTL